MKIRQARFSDLDRIIEIELEIFSLEEAIPRSVFEAHLREIQTSFLVAEKRGVFLVISKVQSFRTAIYMISPLQKK